MFFPTRCDELFGYQPSEGTPVCPRSPNLLLNVSVGARRRSNILVGTKLITLVSAAIVLLILCFDALVPASAGAQAVYGGIFGTVTDQFGAEVVGVKLTGHRYSKRHQV